MVEVLPIEKKEMKHSDHINLSHKYMINVSIYNFNLVHFLFNVLSHFPVNGYEIYESLDNYKLYSKCEIIFGDKKIIGDLVPVEYILERMNTDSNYKNSVMTKLRFLFDTEDIKNLDQILKFDIIIDTIKNRLQQKHSERYYALLLNLYNLKNYPSKYSDELGHQIKFTENELYNELDVKSKNSDETLSKKNMRQKNKDKIKRYEDVKAYDRFQELWNKKDFGPIVATMIYIAYIHDGLDFESLIKAWQMFLERIYKIRDTYDKEKAKIPLFLYIFTEIKRTVTLCYYKSENYNFVRDFLIYGGCNCECGSYLLFVLSKMFSEDNLNTVFTTIPKHAFVLLTLKKQQKIYNLETTFQIRDFIIRKFNPSLNIENMVSSEQILSLTIFLISSRIYDSLDIAINRKIVMKMLGLSDADSCDIRMINIRNKHKLKEMVPTPYDSDALFLIYSTFSKKKNKPFLAEKNLKEYLQAIIDKKEFTIDEIENRMNNNIKNFMKICK